MMPPIEQPVTLIGGVVILFALFVVGGAVDRAFKRRAAAIGEQRPGDVGQLAQGSCLAFAAIVAFGVLGVLAIAAYAALEAAAR